MIELTHSQAFFASWMARAAMFVVVVALLGGMAYQYEQWRTSNESFQRFWAPFSHGSKPALIYIGANYSYRLSHEYLQNYRTQHNFPDSTWEFFVDFKPDEMISKNDLRPFRNLIGFTDVAATARIIATLTNFQEKYDLRYGDDITITDLRSSPGILIGGFSNPWTMQLMQGSRYTLERGQRIVDNTDKSIEWHTDASALHYDYAVVSRLSHSKTENFVLAIGGISGPSNQAAADFISDPIQIEKLLKKAPAGWDKMNMQIVLRTQTINDIPTSAEVQAVYFW